MFNIGPQEVLIILIVALIVVGPKRLPELGRTIGKGLNEFRKLQDEVKDMVKFDLGSSPADLFRDTEPDPDPVAYHATDEEPEDVPDPITHSERVVSLADEDEADPEAVADLHDDTASEDLGTEDSGTEDSGTEDSGTEDTGQGWTAEPGDTSFLRPVDDRDDDPPAAAAE
jgi:sec-independent protein translocase protein TatA